MSVYLKDGLVLLHSDLIATDAACCCCPSVTFDGITFCTCNCLFSNGHNVRFFSESGLNSTLITTAAHNCYCHGGETTVTLHHHEGCPGSLDFQTGVTVYVVFTGGIYYISIIDLSNFVIFFYGTTTSLGIPAANEVTCTLALTTWDNPLMTCVFQGAVQFCGASPSTGTATLS